MIVLFVRGFTPICRPTLTLLALTRAIGTSRSCDDIHINVKLHNVKSSCKLYNPLFQVGTNDGTLPKPEFKNGVLDRRQNG